MPSEFTVDKVTFTIDTDSSPAKVLLAHESSSFSSIKDNIYGIKKNLQRKK